MNIKEAVIEAVTTSNAVMAGQISDQLKHSFGMNYDQIYETINRAHPVGIAEWDELLYEADEIESRQ